MPESIDHELHWTTGRPMCNGHDLIIPPGVSWDALFRIFKIKTPRHAPVIWLTILHVQD